LSEPLPRQHSTLLSGDAVDADAKLKEEHERNLVIFKRDPPFR